VIEISIRARVLILSRQGRPDGPPLLKVRMSRAVKPQLQR
jgi:hypothetical protein